MKIKYTKNGIVAEAESVHDAKILLSLLDGDPENGARIGNDRKRNYSRNCQICGKKVKDRIGLAVHTRHAHPVDAPRLLAEEKNT